MRMRTINEAHKELVAVDPNCALKNSTLRRLVDNGSIPSVKIGNRRLIDLDMLESYLKEAVTL